MHEEKIGSYINIDLEQMKSILIYLLDTVDTKKRGKPKTDQSRHKIKSNQNGKNCCSI